MQIKRNYHQVICIYAITNKVNKKKYVGKTINLQNRLRSHVYYLEKDFLSKGTNKHFFNAWKKYGRENFECSILEQIDNYTPELLAEREVYWITKLNTVNRKKGYNLVTHYIPQNLPTEDQRIHRSQSVMGENNPNWGNKWTSEKKEYLSLLKKEMFANNLHGIASREDLAKGTISRQKRFNEDQEYKHICLLKQSLSATKYNFYQFTKDNQLVKVWNSVYEILRENPTYKKHNIYAVCSGEKPSMYGFIWRKVKINDIVQS